jgi:putative ABC transport system ATP-binding protein
MIDIQNLSKKYERDGKEFFAVSDASLKIENTDFVCITGRSGSGKSTLLNLISGLLRSDAGTIRIENTELQNLSDNQLSLFRNEHIGYVTQGHSLISNLSVLDNVRLPYYLYKREDDITEKAQSLLEMVGILDLQNDNPKNLSGGERKRVSIARSLICDPILLIADEPTGDLDRKTTETVMELFSEIHKAGTSIIMVTHETDLLAYASRHLSMDEGVLTAIS